MFFRHLVCEDDLLCIEKSAVCDHEVDCVDGLDETAWCLDRDCDSGQYKLVMEVRGRGGGHWARRKEGKLWKRGRGGEITDY